MGRVFRHAVASFEPTSSGVILWTRLTEASSARWTVARDPALTDVVARGDTSTSVAVDFTVRVDVEGLEPATTYWYAFEAAGEGSPVGRTRTLPDDRSAVRLALISCARYSYAPLTVYRALAELDVDLVVHVGDYIYEDEGQDGPRRNRPPHAAVSLADYRGRIAQIREDADAQSMHLRHPMVAVWDDHDLADNAWSDGAKAHDPDAQGPWSDRTRAAAQARFEWLPGRYDDPLVPWRAVSLGGVGELLLLDTRLAGRDEHAGDEGTPDLHDRSRSLLGESQRAWLDERLHDVSRPWSVVVSSVVVNSITLRIPGATRCNALLPNGYAALDGHVMHDDQWDGYPAEREHLVAQLSARMRRGARTLLVSGDVHASWAFEGPCDVGGMPVALEVTTPSVSSTPFARSQWPLVRRVIHRAVRELEHVHWCDLTERGFTVVEVGADLVTAEWWFVDPADPRDPPHARRGMTLAGTLGLAPRWVETQPLALGSTATAGAPPLPPRPDDVAGIRRARRARAGAKTSAAVAALAASAAVVAGAVRTGLRRAAT